MKDSQFSDFIAEGLEIQIGASNRQAEEVPASAEEMRRVAACETAVLALVRAHGVSAILLALNGAADVVATAIIADFDPATFEDFGAQIGAALETIAE